MTTTRTGQETLAGAEDGVELVQVSVSALGSLQRTVAVAEMSLAGQHLKPSGPGEEGDSRIGCADKPNAQQTRVAPPRPPLKLMNPEGPLRYIPIHVWPEHLKKVQPRTGRRYCPKRSRTVPKRKSSSPLVREYQFTQEDLELPCDAQGFSDAETDHLDNGDSSTLPATVKRRGWGHALLGVVQNAVPRRSKEEKDPRLPVPRSRKSLSLTPLRFGHYPLELGRRVSLGSLRR